MYNQSTDHKPERGDARELEIIGTNDAEAVPELDQAAQSRLMRKIDLRLIPMLFILFLLAFIDRSVHIWEPSLLKPWLIIF